MKALADQARRVLLRRRESLLESLAGRNAIRMEADAEEEEPDPVARADDPSAEKVQRELADIEAALRRIEEGTWGRCERCGGPIGRQRLIAMPEARQCLSCRTRKEAQP